MASPKFSFTIITPQEFENCRKASAEAATTASLPVDPVTSCKPPRKFSAPVGVVTRLKKTKEPSATSSHDSTLHKARLTIPVFAIGCVPKTITVIYAHLFSPLLLFLHPSSSGITSSNSAFSEHFDFSATSASDFYMGRLMSMIQHLKAWQRTVQPRIDEAMVCNHSPCLHGAQDPLQVIRLENPGKIW
jgi:hypothetical protein